MLAPATFAVHIPLCVLRVQIPAGSEQLVVGPQRCRELGQTPGSQEKMLLRIPSACVEILLPGYEVSRAVSGFLILIWAG